MTRYIDAEKLLAKSEKLKVATDDLFGMGITRGIERVETAIEMQPTADVAEVKHGKWVDNEMQGSMLSKCSLCGFPCGAYSFNYCPKCGAKMDGGKI